MTIPDPWLLAFSITAASLCLRRADRHADAERCSLATAASVVAHGITGTHLSVVLGRRRQREAAPS